MPATYEQPEYVEKRLRYFDGQFLKDQDFIDEQQYHIDRQRRLSKILQVSGICQGLEVTAKGVDQAILAPGAAVDAKGRLIVLGAQEVIALATSRNKIVNLFVSYQEIEADRATEGSEGNRRWHEKPLIAVVAEGDPDPQESVKLAKLSVDKDGLVKVDSTVRQYSGVYLPAGGGNGPTLRSGGDSASNLAVLTGDLNVTGSVRVSGSLTSNSLSLGSGSITAGSATISGNLTTTGNAGIGTANPTERLDVAGNIKASGSLTAAGATISSTLSFGSTVRQMIHLFSQTYGIGVQGSTQYFRTDKNFAWYKGGSHNDGELNAGTGGTVQMAIKDGNVGIGTANPTEKLEVAGNIKASGSLTAAGATISGALTAGTFTVNTLSVSSGITAPSATINGNLTATGNVGIGTSPSAITKLNIAQSPRTGTHPNPLGLYVTADFDGDRNGIEFRHSNGTQGIGLASCSIYATGSNLDQDLNLLPRGAGKVGIGTASPTEKLDVAGNIKASGSIQPSAGNSDTSGIIFPKDPAGGGGDIAWIRYYARSGEDCTLEIGVANDSSDHIVLMPNAGNVGIGTASPTEKLDVAGNIKASGSLTAASATISGAFTAGTFTVNSLSVGSGGITAASGTLSFGSTVRQMINLWSASYGIGVQAGTQYFRTDRNFAWYKGGSHNDAELNAGTGGTVQMAIKDGNVGIGTASPTEKLDVAGNIKASGSLTAAGATISGALTAGTFSVNTFSVSSGITAPSATINGNLTATGNVGIGTSPSAITKLNIAQSPRTGTHPNPLGLYVTADFDGDRNGIEFRHSNGTQGIGLAYCSIYATGSNTDQDLNLLPRGAGKVGIGTTAPSEKLDVVGNIKVNGYYAAVGSEVLRIIRGAVRPTGAIDSGSGFTVSRITTGVYDITFSAAFSAKPTVVLTQHYPDSDDFTITNTGGNTLDNATVIAVSTTKCRVKCGDGAGNGADRRFEFIAIGTR